jgi:hypothetical protein
VDINILAAPPVPVLCYRWTFASPLQTSAAPASTIADHRGTLADLLNVEVGLLASVCCLVTLHFDFFTHLEACVPLVEATDLGSPRRTRNRAEDSWYQLR